MNIKDGRKDAEGNYRAKMIEWFYDLNYEPEKILVDTITVDPPGSVHGSRRNKWVVKWEQIILDENGVRLVNAFGDLRTVSRSHSNTYAPPWYREDGNW